MTASTWMSSRFTIRRFSGRVTPWIAPMMAVVLRAAQDVAQRQAAGHGVGIGIVVQQDQHAVGVAEVALVLLDARARQRSAELGQQRAAEELRHRRDTTTSGNSAWSSSARFAVLGADADAQHVDERAARVADGLEDLLQAAPAVVFDDDAGARGQVGLDVGVGAAGVAGDDVDAGVVQAPRERACSRRGTRLRSRAAGSRRAS